MCSLRPLAHGGGDKCFMSSRQLSHQAAVSSFLPLFRHEQYTEAAPSVVFSVGRERESLGDDDHTSTHTTHTRAHTSSMLFGNKF